MCKMIKILTDYKLKNEYNYEFTNIFLNKKYKFWNDTKIVLTYISGSSSKKENLFPKIYIGTIGLGNRLMYTNLKDHKYVFFFNSKIIRFIIKITQFVYGQ